MTQPAAVQVRPERPADAGAIRLVNDRAFGQPAEGRLVEALRTAGVLTLSLVAEADGIVIGHIAFSPVEIQPEPAQGGSAPAAAVVAGDLAGAPTIGLAPMAVAPEWQRRGVGGQLVRAGLGALAARGCPVVVVLGHPRYYPRFGFQPASRWGLRWEHPCPDEAFMALELRPGALRDRAGVVRFRPEFDAV